MPRVLSCSQEGSEKEVDLGWSLVSSITCLWDRWLLGDRCKMTIDDSVIAGISIPEMLPRKLNAGSSPPKQLTG